MDYFLNSFFVTLGILLGLIGVLTVLAVVGNIISFFNKK